MRSQRLYLTDILDAMSDACAFIEGMTLDEVAADRKTQLALERCFEIVGEAAKKVDPELRARYPEVPWTTMAGMRDVLIHGYWAVQLDVVWDTIKRDLPGLIPHLRRILRELPPDA
ncbi:MAG: DUF86 domain-containing protein [Bacteroidetes bacterium]|nr:MAG: DUF86 domain-containing protein [Bacteroidota bacterium]